MNKIFPPEIIDLTVENHFSRFSKPSNRIYIYSLLFIIGIIASSFFIKTKVSVQSKGLIRPMAESTEITSPVIAEVVKTSIYENKFFKQGDTLVWLNHEKLQQRTEQLRNLILQDEIYQKDLILMLDNKYANIETELYKSVSLQYKQKLTDFDLRINLLQKSFDRTQLLYEKEVIPLAEKEEQEFQLQRAIEEKNIFIRQNRSEWQKLFSEYELAIINNNNEIDGLRKEFNNYIILSPCNGYVTNFNGIQNGSFVTTGQTIAVISPDDKLISEHMVSPKDIGYLRKKMLVVFQVDAYNYNQWGLASGEIIDISNEIYLVNNQPCFKVRCNLNEQYLTLKNGFKGHLKNGLTTTARFQVTERTLAQLLFDKADNWLNPKIE